MQYSRYYHLLNFITRYEQVTPTLHNGKYTKGLYTDGRCQSKLSMKSSCLPTLTNLIEFAKAYSKNLAISFAYPADPKKQKTDRYVMSLDDLVGVCHSTFGSNHVELASCDYRHSNNRNSSQKKVVEYLVLCKAAKGKN
jgi:adenine-specific DNA methylase